METKNNTSKSLRNIYEHFVKQSKPIDTFLDESSMYNLLLDFNSGKNLNEINWIIESIRVGAVTPLVEAKKGIDNKDISIEKSKKILEDNGIREDRIEYVLNCFCYAFGWTDKILSMEDIKEIIEERKRRKERERQERERREREKQQKQKESEQKNKVKQGDNLKKTKTNEDDRKAKNRLNAIKHSYNILDNNIDNQLNNIRLKIQGISYFNSFLKAAVNLIIIYIAITGIWSFIGHIKEGYMYFRIFALDIVSIIIGFILIKNCFQNLMKVKKDLSAYSIYNKLISVKGRVSVNLSNINTLSSISEPDYNEKNTLLTKFNEDLNIIKLNFDRLNLAKNTSKKTSMMVCCFIIIYIISGLYESQLIYNGNSILHKFSRVVVEAVSGSIHKEAFAYVKSDEANIREGAGKDSEIIAIANKKDILNLTGKSYKKDDITWHEVKLNDELKGWISSAVIIVVPKEVEINEEYANVRVSPNLDADIAITVKSGEVFATTGNVKQDDARVWYEIYVGGSNKYWISSKVIKQ